MAAKLPPPAVNNIPTPVVSKLPSGLQDAFNKAPVMTTDHANVTEDTGVQTIDLRPFFSDADHDTLNFYLAAPSASGATLTKEGLLQIDTNSAFFNTLNDGQTFPDALKLTVDDNHGHTITPTFNLNIDGHTDAVVHNVAFGQTYNGTAGVADYFVFDPDAGTNFNTLSSNLANWTQINGFDPAMDKIVIEHMPTPAPQHFTFFNGEYFAANKSTDQSVSYGDYWQYAIQHYNNESSSTVTMQHIHNEPFGSPLASTNIG